VTPKRKGRKVLGAINDANGPAFCAFGGFGQVRSKEVGEGGVATAMMNLWSQGGGGKGGGGMILDQPWRLHESGEVSAG